MSIDNNILYIWEMRRDKDGSVKLPLDTVRAKKSAHVSVVSGAVKTTIYSVASNRKVYINQVTATDMSGNSKWFAVSCMNLSGEVTMTPKLAPANNSSGFMTTTYDNRNDQLRSGAELVYSGQTICVASGPQWNGEIGITITEDSRIDE
jgi:hypothetical protein